MNFNFSFVACFQMASEQEVYFWHFAREKQDKP